MIIWKNEEIVGRPTYNITADHGVSMTAVRLVLENQIVSQGTPCCAENMNKLAQAPTVQHFYYDGVDVPVAPFVAATGSTSSGVVLAKCRAGDTIHAHGVVYLADDEETRRLTNPQGIEAECDATLYCRVGDVVYGVVL